MSAVFEHPTMVRHQRWVITFALHPETGAVYADILDVDPEAERDDLGWTGFTPLRYPGALSPIGVSLLAPQMVPAATGSVAAAPMQAVSDGQYLYLFQPSTEGTLYVTTLLVTMRSETGADPVPVLEPAWEVRYKRSGKRDVQAQPADGQSYQSADGAPYLRPTIELSMIDGLEQRGFAVALVPTSVLEPRAMWHIFSVVDDRVRLYSLPFSETRVADVADKAKEESGHIAPDAEFALAMVRDEQPVALSLVTGPAAVFYLNQERTDSEAGDVLLKRSGRLMLTMAAMVDDAPQQALLELTVAADGTLAQPDDTVVVQAVDPMDYALRFRTGAFVALKGGGVTLNDQFTVEGWVYPTDITARHWIVGGAAATPEAQLAPFLRLEPGGFVTAGFGDGTQVVAGTTRLQLQANRWYALACTWDGSALTVYVNGDPELTGVVPAAGGPPTSPIDTFGRLEQGFVGVLDEVAVWSVARTETQLKKGLYERYQPGPDLAGYWAMNAGQGSTLRDLAGSADGVLQGPVWVPSDSPVQPANVAAIYVDDRGLTLEAGILPWLQTDTAASLLDGADGLVHLYFRSLSDAFSVAQYDTQAARATFVATWQAGAGTSVQQGYVQFVARRSGSALNTTAITVSDAAISSLCTVGLGTDAETWCGVPRNVGRMSEVMTGRAQADPAATPVQSGQQAFYDFDATFPQAVLVTDAERGEHVAFVTGRRNIAQAPLAHVSIIEQGASRDVHLTFAFKGGQGGIVQSWPGVPAAVGDMTRVLRGFDATYGYAMDRPADTPVYALDTEDGAVLLIGDPDAVASLNAAVGPAQSGDARQCRVTIQLDGSGGSQVGTWDDVPRAESTLGAVLQGVDPDYDYAANASANSADMAEFLAVIDNGQTGEVVDQSVNTVAGLGATTLLLEVVATDVPLTTPLNAAELDASIIQGIDLTLPGAATLHDQVVRGTLAQPRAPWGGPVRAVLFGVAPATLPDNGWPGLVANTPAATLYQSGRLGGWIIEPQRYCLAFRPDSAVGSASAVTVDTTRPSFDALALRKALTVEAWVKPQPDTDSTAPQRIVEMALRPDADDSDADRSYMLGVESTRFLQVGNTTYVQLADASGAFGNGGFTLQLWLRPHLGTIRGDPARIARVSAAGASTETLELEGDGKLVYVDAAGARLAGPVLPDGEWSSIGVVRRADSVLILVAGVGPELAAAEVPTGLSVLELVPQNQTFEAGLNELRLWSRELDTDEVATNYGRVVSPYAAGLTVRWSLDQSKGTTVRNLAATGEAYDGQVLGQGPYWMAPGIFCGINGGSGDRILRSNGGLVLSGAWAHLSMASRSGCGLDLRGGDHVDCGNSRSLDISDSFTASAWVQLPSGPRPTQVVLSKWGTRPELWSYQLGVSPAGVPYAQVRLTNGKTVLVTGSTDVRDDHPHHLAFTVVSETKGPEAEDGDVEYRLSMTLFVDGAPYSKVEVSTSEALVVQPSKIPFNIGRQLPDATGDARGQEQLYLRGRVSDVTLWDRALSVVELLRVATTGEGPSNRDGLLAEWRFQEMEGKVAYDVNDVNNGVINSNQLWVWFDATSRFRLYVDGEPATDVDVVGPAAVNGYAGDQFTIGAQAAEAGFRWPLEGQMDDLRIWSAELTREQVADSQYKQLAGNEPALAGYWAFDSNSGTVAHDVTANDNDGQLTGAPLPTWQPSDAPISNEAPEVFNVLGGVDTGRNATITQTPAAAEYADLQFDAQERLISVMKRTYAAPMAQQVELITGFKVGDLELKHIGQVQTEPTLMGYIEGAPPLPSENMTRPLWQAPDADEYRVYAGASSVSMNQAQDVRYAFGSSTENGLSVSANIRAGLFFNNEVSVGSPFLLAESTTLTGHVGVRGSIEYSRTGSNVLGTAVGRTATLADQVVSGGNFEPQDRSQWLNPEVGRRFVPGNNGYALVKSLTADLYASFMRQTGALVSLDTVPNADIPEDVNVISFPMNREYTTAGVLDGKVGFVQAPQFLPGSKAQSYYKPVEAYRLRQQVDKQTQQAEAYYRQFDAEGRGKAGRDGLDDQLADDPYFDWERGVPRRSMVNTYVWTAGGGLHVEEESFLAMRSEQHSGTFRLGGGAGIDARAEAAFFVGLYLEFDLLIGGHREITVTKGKEEGRAFSMTASVGADRFLKRWVGEKDDTYTGIVNDGYTATDCPGKVRGYRFMSFYLTPDARNAQDFLDVVDAKWLRQSGDPNATALATATGGDNGVWRVMHRVTYVDRVPPTYQNVSDETVPQGPAPPPYVDDNAEIVTLVDVTVNREDPTPGEVGDAVTTVLFGTEEQPEPVLSTVLPWWTDFVAAGEVYGSEERTALLAFRRDLVDYMVAWYATRPRT